MALSEAEKKRRTEVQKAAFYAAEQAYNAGSGDLQGAANRAAREVAKQNKGADKPVPEPVTGQDAETDLIGSTKKIARTGSASRRREQAQSGYEDVYKRRKLQSDAWMAEKAHADYIKSDEYRQRTAEREKKLQQDRFMKQLLTGVADIQEPQLIEDEKEVQLRAAARQARAAADAEEDAAVVRRDMAEIGAMSDEERRQLERFAVGQDVDYFDSMNFAQNGLQIGRAERQAAGLMEKYGEKRLNELANTLRRQQNARMAQEAAQKGREQVTGGFWNGVGESAATVPIMAANGPMAALSFLRELSRGDDRYNSLDPNAIGNMGSVYSGAVRGQVQQNIEGEDPGFWRKAASVGYQGIMAAADSVAQAYLGGGAWGGAALAATNSFSQTMAEASRNGATPGEAALLATSTAAIEVLSEKIPLDELIKTAGRNKQGVRQIVKTALAQAGIEATTEEISLVGSLLLEAAILGEKSGYEQTAMQGILQGKSVAQARQDAAMEVWNEAVNTAMVSGFSGFASSGGAGIAGNVRGAMRDARANLPDAERIKRDALAMARELDSQGEGAQPPQTEPEQAQNGADIAVQANDAAPSPAPEMLPGNDAAERAQKNTVPEETAVNVRSAGTALTEQNKEKNRIEESPSGNSKYGVTDGADNSGKAGMPMGPEGLSEGNNPSASAEPMLLPDNSIPENGAEVNGNPESAPTEDTQNQSAEGGQSIKGTGAAEADFTGTAAYDSLLSDENVQRERKGDGRYIEVPKTDADGKNISEFVGNSMNSALTPESFTNSIKKLVQEGRVSHDVQTNEESLRKAADMIAKDGSIYKSVRDVKEFSGSGKFSPEYMAKATLLYQTLTERIEQQSKSDSGIIDNDTAHSIQDMAEDVYISLSEMATSSGRTMQLFNLFRKMTPEGQLNILKKEVEREIAKLQKQGTVKKDYQTSFDQELLDGYKSAAEAFLKASDSKAKKAAEESMRELQNAIYIVEAAKMPTTFKAKWDAWRYMAMLGNVKTQLRNFAGNVSMMPYTAVRRRMSALVETAFIQDKSKRTKSVIQDKELLKWARSDRETNLVRDALKHSAMLGDDTSKSVMADNLKIFGDGILEKVRTTTNGVVSAGDILFKNHEYAVSLAGFLKARGITMADIQNKKVKPDVLNEARNYAVNEALKATFNDTNAFSDFMTNRFLRVKGNTKYDSAWNALVDGVLPFRKTPANVIMRFKDYSPAGLAQGIGNAIFNLHRGKVSAATVIDQLSAGMTGTAATVLGYALAGGFGGLKLKIGGDEDEPALLEIKGITGSQLSDDEKRQGHQEYALEFSVNGQDYSYKIDWAAPANLPLFLGANYYKAVENAGGDTSVSQFTSLIRGMGTMFEPVLALSCMSSLADLFEAGKYSMDNESIFVAASQAATSYFTQGIPALARQAAQALQENRQTTFANNADPTIRDLQKTAANVPFVGAKYQTDKINAWGEAESTGNAAARVINAFLNPGTLKKISTDALEKEISRLNEVQTESVSPPTAPKTVSYTDKDGSVHKDVRLTEEQYHTLAVTQGQTAKKILDSMIKLPNYMALTDEQKAKAFDLVYSYAKEKGEIAAIGKDKHTGYSDDWMMELTTGAEASQIIRRITKSELNRTMSALSTAWYQGYDETVRSQDLKTAYDSYSKMSSTAKAQVRKAATGTTAKYIEAREKGISHENFLKAAENVAKVKGTGSNGTVRDIDRREAIAKTTGLSEKAIDTLMKCYMPDYDPEDDPPDRTEVKYDYIRQEMGLSAKEYTAAYRAYSDNDKKYAQVNAIRDALGCSQSAAYRLYSVYSGNDYAYKQYVKLYE